MNRLIKFSWTVSVLIFLLLLLWVYSYLPGEVALSKDEAGLVTSKISRGSFFYISLAVFVASNLILYVLAKLVRVIPKGSTSLLANSAVALRVEGWVVSFSWALNICYMFLLLYFGLFNNPGSFRYAEYSHILIYMIPMIILLWLFALVVLLLGKGQKAGD